MNRYHQAVTTICTALTLGALGGVFTASATASPVPLSVAAFVTAAATPTSDNPRTLDLREGWHFRWGDSPAGESGSFAWLDEPLTAPDWTPTKKLVWSVEGPDGIGTIWLRIRLPKTRWKTPTLYLPHIPEAFEAYVGTERVAKRGVFVEGANKYALSGVTIVPLGPDYAGKVLTLRIYSSVHGDIGPQTDGDPVTIGSAHSVMVSVLRRSLETTLFGLAACFLGLVSLLISFRRLAAKKHLPFALGMFSLSIGVFYVTLPPLFSLIVESDAVRYYAQILSYMIFPVWLYVFVETVLGGHRVVRALWIVQAVYAVVWLAVELTNVGPRVLIESVSPFIFSITILIMIGVAGRVAFSGHREARILLFGIMIMGLAGLNDLLMGIVFPYWHWISPAGTFIFILVLVYITDNRYAQRNRLLKTYSLQLEEKSEQLEEHARTLEQKVTERTRDLDTRNQELAGTLDELRDTQEQLVLREKMASLGNLVAGVAHEVNNPVGAIVSAADASSRCIKIVGTFVEEHGGGEPRLHKALAILGENNEIITTASQRVTNIVRSLRNFSRLDEAEFQKADLHEGLDSTLTLVHHQMKDRVEVVKEYGDLPLIECYPNQLNQVFMNILVNAAQAIEGKGTITIRTQREGEFVSVRITDTGKGISPENIAKLFDPGFTTKGVGVGTGLGLSISYKIISNHGGTIDVESEVGRGTSLTIRVPIKAKKKA